ncbi:MAG: hypothetical protein CME62_03180 [Halobacteriovoraceae bacterium]|nr:hypothetical protein [Halobacteriovoraceae bacterium]
MNLSYKKIYSTFIVFSLFIIFRIDYLVVDSLSFQEWDPLARISTALIERDTLYKYLFPNYWWLPGHFYFIRLYFFFFNSSQYLVLFHAVCLGGAISTVYYLAINEIKSNFNMMIVALVAVTFSLNSIFFLISLQALSEPFFLLLVAISFIFYKRLLSDEFKVLDLVGFLFFANFACLTRFEGWLIFSVLGLYLGYNKKLTFLIKLLPLAIAPAIWFGIQFYEKGNVFYWLGILEREGSIKANLLGSMTIFIKIFKTFLVSLLPLSLLYFIKDKRKTNVGRSSFLCIVILFSFLTFQIFEGNIEPSERYSVTCLFMLYIFVVFTLATAKLEGYWAKFLSLYIVLSVLLVNSLFWFQNMSVHYDLMPKKTNELIEQVSKLDLEPGRTIFFPRVFRRDTYLKLKLGWFNAGHVEKIIDDNSYIFMRVINVNPWKFVKKEQILERKRLKYIVYVNGVSVEKFSEMQLKYLEFPEELIRNFRVFWKNRAGIIYQRVE